MTSSGIWGGRVVSSSRKAGILCPMANSIAQRGRFFHGTKRICLSLRGRKDRHPRGGLGAGDGAPGGAADLPRGVGAHSALRAPGIVPDGAGLRRGGPRPPGPRHLRGGGGAPAVLRAEGQLELGGAGPVRPAGAGGAAVSRPAGVPAGALHGLLPGPDIPDPLSRHRGGGHSHGHRPDAPGGGGGGPGPGCQRGPEGGGHPPQPPGEQAGL